MFPKRVGNSTFNNNLKIDVYTSPFFQVTQIAKELITWNHNFGFNLTNLECELVCKLDNFGYVKNDIIAMSDTPSYSTSQSDQVFGYGLSQDLNNVYIQAGFLATWLNIYSKIDGVVEQANVGDWEIRIRGEKITIGNAAVDITHVGVEPIEKGRLFNESQYETPILTDRYCKYELLFSNLLPVSSFTNPLGLISTNFGYEEGSNTYFGRSYVLSDNLFIAEYDEVAIMPFTSFLNTPSLDSPTSATGRIEIYPAFEGGNPTVEMYFIYRNEEDELISASASGMYFITKPIDRFKLFFNSGNIATMSYQLNGYRRPI